MKVAVLTLPLHSNYGGILQCYALCSVISKMGHTVVNVNLQPPKPSLPYHKAPLVYLKRSIKRYLLHQDCIIFRENKEIEEYPIVIQNIKRFIDRYIPNSEFVMDSEDLVKLADSDIDAYIVGSDQVWKPAYSRLQKGLYFLQFTQDKEVKRIAYAASFGTSELEYNQQLSNFCNKLIQKFDAVSVREESAIDLIKYKYKWDCKIPKLVLDPTLLLTQDEYLGLFNKSKTNEYNNLYYYLLDINEEKLALVKEICDCKKLQPIAISSKQSTSNTHVDQRILPPVEDWLNSFYQADFIFTDSFHGCVFAIIFNKPFVVYGNRQRGIARFQSLLSVFNLQDRYIDDVTPYKNELIDKEIDWSSVNKIKANLRKESLSFLQSNIN